MGYRIRGRGRGIRRGIGGIWRGGGGRGGRSRSEGGNEGDEGELDGVVVRDWVG